MRFYFFAVLTSFLFYSHAFSVTAISNDFELSFGKEIYYPGEVAKVVLIVKNRPQKPEFEYVIEGTQSINGFISKIEFDKFGNIFIGTTEKLQVEASLNLVIKLQNIKKIRLLQKKISEFEIELVRLKTLYQENENEELLKHIVRLERKINDLKSQVGKESIIVKKIYQKLNIPENSCNFSEKRSLEIIKSNPPKPRVYVEDRSHFFEIDGAVYEVRFSVKKIHKTLKPSKRKYSSGQTADQCIEEEDPDNTDYMYPSWTIGRSAGRKIESTYESSVRCFMGPDPVACKASYTISAGLCDGRHSKLHKGTRPLGYMKNGREGHVYDVPATEEGLPYTYVAPDVSGDVKLNFTFYLSDQEEPVFIPYLLRVGLTHLVDLKDTPFLSDYLTFNFINSHDYGTYGVENFGNTLYVALKEYVTEAKNLGISNPTSSPFYPLNSEGVSLQFGGLFDIYRDWDKPHKSHRQGVDIDIGMSILKKHPRMGTLMEILDKKMRINGFKFVEKKESFEANITEVFKDGFHWHATYPDGAIVK